MHFPTRSIAGAMIAAFAAVASAQTTPPAPQGFATVRGTAYDSIRHAPLARAVVAVEGTTRLGFTDANGDFIIDSIKPGSHRLSVSHPLLDTLGMTLMTGAMVMRPEEVLTVELATPSAARVVSMRCPAAVLQLRGPGAVMGQVTDPDSLKAAIGSRVELVYAETVLGFKGKPTVRNATVDSSGSYRICGLPTPIAGKLQVFRNGVSSGEIDITVDGTLGLRSLTIAAAQAATTTSDSLGRVTRISSGTSRLTGHVYNADGRPIEAARVSVAGAAPVSLTNARGEFTLDSLPSGTQSVVVRKLGYAAVDKAVELSARAPATASLTLAAIELAPVKIEATRAQKALDDLGYSERKRSGFGTFLDGDKLAAGAQKFTDNLRTVSGLRLVPTGGSRYLLQDTRDPVNGCVNIYVDNARWREMSPGDIDDFIRGDEIRAMEVYRSSETPAKFQTPGTSCATVVAWTNRYIDRHKK